MNTTTTTTPAIEAENLTRYYGLQPAIRNITFSIPQGQIVGFLGPNGAGKTTTMRILTGFMAPTSGTARIFGEEISNGNPEPRKAIGYLPENNPLYTDMPVIDFLKLAGHLQGLHGKQLIQRIRQVIDICQLGDEQHKRIGELSKGYRQRVGLAQALIHDPPVLIMDEPTSGLDPIQTIQVRELIRQLGKEKTILLSTHILPEVEAICERILIIHRGQLVADGSPDELRQSQQAELILRIDNAPDPQEVINHLATLPGVKQLEHIGNHTYRFLLHEDSDQIRRALFHECVEHNWIILEMHGKRQSLEEVFRRLTLQEPTTPHQIR